MEKPSKKLYVARPRGFCAGVDRAIDIVELALELYGIPLYVKHAIVHNVHVVKSLEKRGVIFVDDVQEIPKGSTVIFSAHGSPPQEFAAADQLNLNVIDAICPLVAKVHLEVRRFSRLGYDIIMVGHKGHVEPIGTLGNTQKSAKSFLIETADEARVLQVPQEDKLAVVTQTTLSINETKEVLAILQERFPKAEFPKKEDICFATTNRQGAVKRMLPYIQALCVVGSQSSSNSNRLRELGEKAGIPSYLVDDAEHIQPEWFTNVSSVGLTSGASVPEYLFEEVKEYFYKKGFQNTEEIKGSDEDVHFSLPFEFTREAKEKKKGEKIVKKHKIESGKKMRT